jgi:hypothetical protein
MASLREEELRELRHVLYKTLCMQAFASNSKVTPSTQFGNPAMWSEFNCWEIQLCRRTNPRLYNVWLLL